MSFEGTEAETAGKTQTAGGGLRRILKRLMFVCALLLLLSVGTVWYLIPEDAVAEFKLPDGTPVVLESTTHGKRHSVGQMPQWLLPLGSRISPVVKRRGALAGQRGFGTPRDALVLWIADHRAGADVKCTIEHFRYEIIDRHGQRWAPSEMKTWHRFHGIGRKSDWHAFVFQNYPRWEDELTLRMTEREEPMFTSVTEEFALPVAALDDPGSTRITFPNPHATEPANWSAENPSVSAFADGVEVVLSELIATNGYNAVIQGWEPQFAVRGESVPSSRWCMSEWTAEDPYGNQGQWLGLHQPALRFNAKFEPMPTNEDATELIRALPELSLEFRRTNWLLTNWVEGVELVALGYAPLEEIREEETGGAYVSAYGVPFHISMVNIRCNDPNLRQKIGVRARARDGRVWTGYLYPSNHSWLSEPSLLRFILDVPDDVTHVVPEIVLLKPIEVEFTVKTPAWKP